MLRNLSNPLALAANLVLLLCIGCAHSPPPSSSRDEIWTTYARNVPHGVRQRVDMFSSSEAAAIVLSGFPGQRVTVSLYESQTGKLVGQAAQNVQAREGRAITLKLLPPGRYTVRASQEGVVRAETQFSVRQ